MHGACAADFLFHLTRNNTSKDQERNCNVFPQFDSSLFAEFMSLLAFQFELDAGM